MVSLLTIHIKKIYLSTRESRPQKAVWRWTYNWLQNHLYRCKIIIVNEPFNEKQPIGNDVLQQVSRPGSWAHPDCRARLLKTIRNRFSVPTSERGSITHKSDDQNLKRINWFGGDRKKRGAPGTSAEEYFANTLYPCAGSTLLSAPWRDYQTFDRRSQDLSNTFENPHLYGLH